jgi:transcription elongation factor GreA
MTDGSTKIEPTRLTAETDERLRAELEDLTTRGRVEIAQAIETARALGDLSENGDYHAAKDAQGKMESRIRQLSALLKNVELVETGAGDGTVAAGSTVTLRYEDDDEDDVQRFFVGSIEERHDGMSVVSPSAPLGQALLGHRSGDTVEYKAPGGTLRVVIVKVGDADG